jgi:shikimate dehydrogenase
MARRIGSINTVVNRDGRLQGFNSDGMGALKAFQDRKIRLEGRRVVILGSGGAARAIAFALLMNAELEDLRILGIIGEEVSALVGDLRRTAETSVHGTSMDTEILRNSLSDSDIVINCTPVGMYPHSDESPVPARFLREALIVFDVVYNPLSTKLLCDARQCGCQTISGIEMFINQAVVQFMLWTGELAPEAVMRKVIMDQVSGQ